MTGHGSRWPAVTVTPDHSGRPVELAPGQELIVRLPSNPTTGYRWSLVAPAKGVLESEGSPGFESQSSGTPLVGAPGYELWRFRAVRRGAQPVRFEYRRPWENDTPPLRVVTFTVTARSRPSAPAADPRR
ncbi:MAG: protease inhibitor I42 family protein [Acidobacteriota bacterium]